MDKKLKISLITNCVLGVILLAIIVNVLTASTPYIETTSSSVEKLTRWLSDNCDYKELLFIDKASTILDEPYDGGYVLNFIGLPDNVTEEEFDNCMLDIEKKRKNEN